MAKTAGFCFGVNRAVELTYGLLAEGHKVATLGPLIHNPQAVEDMRRKGAQVVDTVQDVPAGCEVVIRSHGVPHSVYDELEARGIPYHDATCPFVQKIQRIAAEAEKEGAVLLVAGDKTHPEVQGIVGHTRGEVFVFADLAELEAWNGPSDPQKPLFAVAQTTFQVTKWKESSEFLKKAYTNARIFDTICNATWARQQEAEDRQADGGVRQKLELFEINAFLTWFFRCCGGVSSAAAAPSVYDELAVISQTVTPL